LPIIFLFVVSIIELGFNILRFIGGSFSSIPIFIVSFNRLAINRQIISFVLFFKNLMFVFQF
jgi:hypothetical protein